MTLAAVGMSIKYSDQTTWSRVFNKIRGIRIFVALFFLTPLAKIENLCLAIGSVQMLTVRTVLTRATMKSKRLIIIINAASAEAYF